MAMENTSNRTDRFRPEVALGASEECLSLPQQEENKDASAEQKQNPALVARHVAIEACICLQKDHVSTKQRTFADESMTKYEGARTIIVDHYKTIVLVKSKLERIWIFRKYSLLRKDSLFLFATS